MWGMATFIAVKLMRVRERVVAAMHNADQVVIRQRVGFTDSLG